MSFAKPATTTELPPRSTDLGKQTQPAPERLAAARSSRSKKHEQRTGHHPRRHLLDARAFRQDVGRRLNFEREAGFAVQIVTANDYAMRIAMDNRQSVINAVTNVAAIGISLNPAKRQAYLVPRDGRICLDISYMGLLDLAIQSGSIMWGQSELVYEQDRFELQGFDKPPSAQPQPVRQGARRHRRRLCRRQDARRRLPHHLHEHR
jgi:hypothetical protein